MTMPSLRFFVGAVLALAGLVDRAVAMTDFEVLLEKLARGEKTGHAIDAIAARPGTAVLAPERARLATFFAAPSVEGVLERLARDGGDFAGRTAAAIRANAPTSLKLTFHMLRRGASLTLAECLRQEYHAATNLFLRPDLKEGVRAAIIDKDRAPNWQPSGLAAVSDAEIATLMAPLTVEVPHALSFE